MNELIVLAHTATPITFSLGYPPGSKNPLYVHLQEYITPEIIEYLHADIKDVHHKDTKSKVLHALHLVTYCALTPYPFRAPYYTLEAPRQLRKLLKRGLGHSWIFTVKKGKIVLRAHAFDGTPIPPRNVAESILQGLQLESVMAISHSPAQRMLFQEILVILLDLVQNGLHTSSYSFLLSKNVHSLVLWSISSFFGKHWKVSIAKNDDGFLLLLKKKKTYERRTQILQVSKADRKIAKKTTPLNERILDYAL